MAYFGGASSYAGDPGIFDVLKRVGRAAIGFATGGPAGAIASQFPTRRPVQGPSGFVRPGRFLPEVGTGLGIGVGTALVQTGAAALSGGGAEAGCPSGYHLNKSDYYTQAGFVAKGTKCVRNRYRNPYNRRSAKKAAYRLKALGTGMKTIKRAVNEAHKAIK